MTLPLDNPTAQTSRVYSIYCLTNTVNGKQYVGQTVLPPRERWTLHVSAAGSAKLQVMGKYCRYLCAAIQKYGRDAFSMRILETVETREEANIREAFWIKEMKTLAPSGYNLVAGGNVKEMSEETRIKMSEVTSGSNNGRFGKPVSEETRRRISLSNIGRKCAPFTDEHRRKIGERNKGKKITPEHVAKMLEAQKAYWEAYRNDELPPEVRERRREAHRGEKNARYGKPRSPETKQRISEAVKKKSAMLSAIKTAYWVAWRLKNASPTLDL